MQRFFAVLLTAAIAAFPAAQAAQTYEAGRDYIEVSPPQPVETGAKIEVREFFFYGCPHCNKFEPPLKAWIKTLPANARFVPTAVVFDRAVTIAFYTFEEMGITGKLHGAIFDAMHVKKLKLKEPEEVAAVVAEHGVDKAKFLQAYNSPAVQKRVEKSKEHTKGFKLEGVPTLVIDGKYMINAKTIGNDADKALAMARFLIDKAAAERGKKK